MKNPRFEDNIFGRRLHDLRKRRGLSMQAFCDGLNQKSNSVFTRSAVSLWEAGKREPFASTIKLLADYFEVSPSYLMGLTDDEHFVEPDQKTISDNYTLSLIEAFDKLSIPARVKLLAYAWDLLDKEGKA